MAIANLHETIQFNIAQRNRLSLEITELQSQKNLALYSQGDVQSLLSAEKHSVRDYFKGLYDDDPALQEKYVSYTEIPDFEEEIDRIVSEYQEQLDELAAWETVIDSQITTKSAELEEIKAYLDSYKSMVSSNIQEDFNFRLNG